jgi:hypothetical protein
VDNPQPHRVARPVTPKTSFLIPVRNAAHTIEDAVRSACAQDDPNLEVVVVDDGSQDGSADAAQIQDPRVRIFRTPPMGIVAALNRGIQQCRGRFIARLDADDVARPNRLSRQIARLEADPSIGAMDGRVRFFRDDGPVPGGMTAYAHWINTLVTHEDILREILVESPLIHPATTLRRDALLQLGGYRHGPFPEDYDLWLRLQRSGWRLAKDTQVLVDMRDRPDRLTRSDPRYAPQAFRTLKQQWLDRGPLKQPRTVVVWGAGKAGGPWIQWLLAGGHKVPAVIDVAPRQSRHGVPVVGPQALPELHPDLMLVAVGARGARAIIRRAIAHLKPRWVEGQNWWAVC